MRLIQQAAATLIVALGLAFSNSAGAVGVGKMCGGIAGIPCDKGLFCDHKPGSCKTADAAGVCVKRTKICVTLYKPVCGCNGKTYSNNCRRIAAGVQLARTGACRKPVKKGYEEDVATTGDLSYSAAPQARMPALARRHARKRANPRLNNPHLIA